MASVNKVTLIGNVGKNPEIRSAQSGARFANFSLATSESWKDKQTGERKEKVEWHNIVVSNDALVSVVERFLKKGSKVYLSGQLQTRKWKDNDGNDRYTTEVILKPFRSEIVLLDRKQDAEDKDDDSHQVSRDAQKPTVWDDELDDEIPFAWIAAFIMPLLALAGVA